MQSMIEMKLSEIRQIHGGGQTSKAVASAFATLTPKVTTPVTPPPTGWDG